MGLIGIISKLNRVEEIIDRVTPKVSADTFLSSISDTIDDIIIKEIEYGSRFIGGKTHFTLSSDWRMIQMYVELFFTKQSGVFFKKETNGTYPVNMLNQEAQETFVAELETGEYVIEVKEP